jgi:hypothetical protein
MSSGTLYRWSGLVLLVGGLLGLVSSILEAVLYPGDSATPAQILSATAMLVLSMSFVGFLLIAIGFPGGYLRQAARAGRLGFVGFVLLSLGLLLGGVGLGAVLTITLPYLAQSAPKLLTGGPPPALLLLLIGSTLLWAVGSIFLGIASIRARVFPRWAGILLLASGIISIIGIPFPPLLSNIIEPAGEVVLFLAFAWFGYALVAQGKEQVAAPSPATPTV